MATSDIPQIPANFDLGSRHTNACNSLREIEVGFESAMTSELQLLVKQNKRQMLAIRMI
jgi:hypothetical protein